MALAGLLFGGYPPLARTVVQRVVPRNYQGRVLGIRSSVMGVGIPVGSYAGGLFGSIMCSSRVMGLAGCVVLMTGILLFAVRSFREM